MHRLPRRALPLALAAILGVAALAALDSRTTPASAAGDCTVADYSLDAEEQAFLTLINTYRAQNGLAALTVSTNLNRAAAWLAIDMGTYRYFSHTDRLGRDPSTRAADCGYPYGAGENIAAGTVWDTAQEAFDAWRNSTGHNQNMLNASYRVIGIARAQVSGSPYNWYWVTDFGLTSDGSSGGTNPTATPTRTPTPLPTATPTTVATTTQRAVVTSPAPGTTLPGSTATFSWTAGSGALEYFFYAGSTPGGNQYLGVSTGLNRSRTVTTLPTNGSTVYVRLWTRFATGWQYNDYTYTAANTGASLTVAKAAITSPAPGSVLPGSSATFSWSAGSGALEYWLYAGSTPGGYDLYSGSQGTSLSRTLSNLPRDGRTIYVRLWTRFSTGWQWSDYTFIAAR